MRWAGWVGTLDVWPRSGWRPACPAPRRSGDTTRAEERTPMSTSAELTRLTLREQSDLLHRRAISPVELTETYLARIEASNATLNAYYTVTAEAARGQAREAEE